MTIVQITDTHLSTRAERPWERLEAALAAAATFAPEAIVLTGDLADRSAPGLNPRLVELLVRAHRDGGAPIVVLPGNHDSAELDALAQDPAYRSVAGAGALHRLAGVAPLDALTVYPGFGLVTLDSRLAASGPGRLSAAQLDWLAGVLTPDARACQEPWARDLATRPILLALHHPPLDSPVTGLHKRGLGNAGELAQVLAAARFPVHGIAAGHYHHGLSGQLGGTSVWVAPALAYNLNVFAPDDVAEGLDRPEFAVLRLGAGGMTAMTVSLERSEPIFRRSVSLADGAQAFTGRR